jgi:parallel beta-helix repeat protein
VVWLLVGGLVAAAGLLAVTGVIQGGPLDPPGPPAPTMKTLDEVEPRTPISTLPFTISSPGSYYVTDNLTGVAASHGISIAASNVTLDLRGFTLTGVAGSLDGIHIGTGSPLSNIRVHNGAVTGWGDDGLAPFLFGEDGGVGGVLVIDVTVEDVRAFDNDDNGIIVPIGSVLRNCSAFGNAGDGIATAVGFNGRIEGCEAFSNTGSGIVVAGGASGGGFVVVNNVSHTNGVGGVGAGILVATSGVPTHVEGNDVVGNDTGIDVDTAGNVIMRNSASGNTVEYDIVVGNDVGPIGTAAASTSPWANIDY